MRLGRPKRTRKLISVVSMIDVLMILLIFFMVTSNYLDLKMLPMVERAGQSPSGIASAVAEGTLMIRLGPDGSLQVKGRSFGLAEFKKVLEDVLAHQPRISVIVLPSGQAEAQSLVSLMDLAISSGVEQLQVLRLEVP